MSSPKHSCQDKGQYELVTQKSDVTTNSKRYGWGIRHVQSVCMCLCIIVLYLARSSMAIAVLAMTDSSKLNSSAIEIYDWDKNTQAYILSSFFWGYLIMQVPSGLLSKKYGGKPILLFAMLSNGLICLTLPTLAHLGGWRMVCAARMAMGLTQACLFPSTHTLLGRWFPSHERTTYSGFIYGGVQIGTIISMPVSGLLSDTAYGWKSIFYCTALVLFAIAALWWWMGASTPTQHRLMSDNERFYIEADMTNNQQKISETPWGHIIWDLKFWAIVAGHTGTAVLFMFFFVDLPTYLEKGMNIPLKDSAWLSALPYIGMWMGGITSTWLCDKIANNGFLSLTACRKIFNSIASFGGAAGLVSLSFLDKEDKTFAVILLVASLAFVGFTLAGYAVNHLDLSPTYAGVMLALTNSAANVGSIFSPLITSFILNNNPKDLVQWKIVFIVIASFTAATNIFYILFASAERQPWDDPLNKEMTLYAIVEEKKLVLEPVTTNCTERRESR